MTYASDFMSDFIRGVVASRPQVAEGWVFVQDVDSLRSALVASVMCVATTTEVKVPHDDVPAPALCRRKFHRASDSIRHLSEFIRGIEASRPVAPNPSNGPIPAPLSQPSGRSSLPGASR
ncbi:hypothetical protein [Roseateles sp. LYH14W]|uniref:Uncharacterized protein n=1 Tax=Pelomonas parva TaxID=3299032 RepID=A0ABW7F8T9_9BURK